MEKNTMLEFRNSASFFSCLGRAKEPVMSAVPHYVTVFLTHGVHIFSENLGATSKV